ncbi:MAG: hypothetical protein IKX76_06890, partial [Eubacterium sp.]|nr:hypothetical protein [Eubacterium sp.]
MDIEMNRLPCDWNCPSVENRIRPPLPDRKLLAFMSNPAAVRKLMEDYAEELGELGIKRYILPVRQNLEAVVYGKQIQNKRGFQTGGNRISGDNGVEDWIP